MHIPDGYIGPQTYLPLFAVMAGMWSIALAKLKKSLRMRQVPLLALGAAFCFVIMMFNVPIPGGTSGHAVGAVLIAILLGPWAACIAVSLAIIVQALIFGDGGITAIGANCFTMGVIMPFVGWGIYKVITASASGSASGSAAASATGSKSLRQWVGAAVGGYAGLGAAGIATGFIFGIQPLIAHDAAGRALYAPFGLNIAVPMMAIEHLAVFGFVEAIVTGLVVAYFMRTAPEMLGQVEGRKSPALVPRLYLALGVLVLLSPLGLLLPAKFNAGAAWGEWNSREIQAEIARKTGGPGYVPPGIQQAEEKGWKAFLPDYALPGKESAPMPYILSGAIGVMLLGFFIMLGKKIFARKDDDDPPAVDA